MLFLITSLFNEPEKPPEWSEDLLLARTAAEGDRDARFEIADRLLDRTRRKVGYLTGQRGRAEDLAQDAMVELLRAIGGYRGDSSLETWADRIITRTVLRRLKGARRHEGEEFDEKEIPGSGTGSDVAVDARRIRGRLAGLLARMSDKKRAVMVLHHVEGYSVAEISAMTGSPEYTVRDRLKTGREELRNHVLRDRTLRGWLDAGGMR